MCYIHAGKCHLAITRVKACYLWQHGTGRLHAKWNKPGAEREASYNHTHMWNLKPLISQNLSVEWQLAEAGGDWEEGKMGKGWSTGTKSWLDKRKKLGTVKYLKKIYATLLLLSKNKFKSGFHLFCFSDLHLPRKFWNYIYNLC